jgi:hypothetical protein
VLKEGSPVALAWRVDYAVFFAVPISTLFIAKERATEAVPVRGKVEAVREREEQERLKWKKRVLMQKTQSQKYEVIFLACTIGRKISSQLQLS